MPSVRKQIIGIYDKTTTRRNYIECIVSGIWRCAEIHAGKFDVLLGCRQLFQRHAYAFYGKGQWFGTMPILKQPHLNIILLVSILVDWQGFMEGAINSGEEAVEGM